MPPFALNTLSLLALAVAYGPLLLMFGTQLWEKPHYQHFPFVLLASGLLIWQRLTDENGESEPYKRWWTLLAFGLAWLLLLVALMAPSPLLGAISFVLLTGGWLLNLAGRLRSPFPTGPWMLLWLLIPLPFDYGQRLIESLQRSSSSLSSMALDVFGTLHLMEGNALILSDKQLFVDEACSGIISVISIVTCAAIYGVWRRRAPLHTLLLMLTAAGWATLLNVVRITSIALAHVCFQFDWTGGLTHTLLGLATFLLSLIALVATDWLLHAILSEIGSRWAARTGEPILFGKSLVRAWDSLTTNDRAKVGPAEIGRVEAGSDDLTTSTPLDWKQLALKTSVFSLGLLAIAAFAGLGATQLIRPAAVVQVIPAAPQGMDRLAASLQEEVMPEHLLGLTLIDIKHQKRDAKAIFGEHSIIFEYADKNSNSYLVSCDFPFSSGWHELSVCYQGIGWQVDDRKTIIQSLTSPQASHKSKTYEYAQLDLSKPNGRMSLVTFCAYYQDGEPVPAQATNDSFFEKVGSMLSRRKEVTHDRISHQVQVVMERSDGEISDLDRRTSEKLLDEARRRFIEASVNLP